MTDILRYISRVVMFYIMNMMMIVSIRDLVDDYHPVIERVTLCVMIVSSFITQLVILGC